MNHEYVKNTYTKIDDIIKNDKNCCKKSCSACCSQQIEVLNFEREAIKLFVKNKLKSTVKKQITKNLIDWLKFFNENTPNKTLSAFDVFQVFGQTKAINTKCPLLINDLCSIYPMRPSACRIHYVVDNPDICKSNKLRDPAPKASLVRAQLIQSLKATGEVTIESLPYIIAEVLLPSQNLKKIEKIVLR